MFYNSFMPYITSRTRVSTSSRTLIDNIFSADLPDDLIAGNIIISISDHQALFLFLPNRKFQKVTKTVIYQRNLNKMNKIYFLNDQQNLNWKAVFSIAKKMSITFSGNITQEIKCVTKDFFSKCDEIRFFLRIWSHLLKKYLMENFMFCAEKFLNIVYTLLDTYAHGRVA